MDEKQIQIIKANFDSKPTEELISIWKNNNQVEYSPSGLEAVRRVLVDRNVPLHEQTPFSQNRQEQAEKRLSESKSQFSKFYFLMLGIGLFGLWLILGDKVMDAILSGSESGGGYSGSEALIRAGELRVTADIIVTCIAIGLCLLSIITHFTSKAKAKNKIDNITN